MFDHRSRVEFPFDRNRLWRVLDDLSQLEHWFAWVQAVDVVGDGVRAGTSIGITIAPPIPYRPRIDVLIERCDPGLAVDATVRGDVAGAASLRLESTSAGSAALMSWRLEPRGRQLRLAALVAMAPLRWAHDQAVELSVARFRHRVVETERQIAPIAYDAIDDNANAVEH